MSRHPSIDALEGEVAARRERLARTVDELVAKATPKAVLQRQAEAARARVADAVQTPEGELRVERVAALAAVVAVVGVLAYRTLRRH